MIKKSFVSIYFQRNKLFVFQLDSKKKKVKKAATADIAEGVIVGYQVKNVEALVEIIRSIYKKYSIKEKAVGIVIPEFATFTKIFEIPKLSYSELHEAVLWQAQEYFPKSLDEFVLDWKIVGRTEKTYKVLLVSVEKSILSGFVEAVELAGLFPFSVETPSLCLIKVVGGLDDEIKLTAYKKNSSELLLIISQGKAVLSSSVVKVSEKEDSFQPLSKMISHYKDSFEVKKVLLAGVGVEKLSMDQVSKDLKLGVEKVEVDVAGLAQDEIQSYLVPYGMQLEDLEDPSDPNSLNLLPLNLVEKYKNASLKLQVWSLVLTVTLFVWVSFTVSLGSYLFLNQQIAASNKLIVTNGSSKLSLLTIKVKDINDKIDQIAKIREIYFYPQNVLEIVNSSKPVGITIDAYDLDMDIGQVRLEGHASDRLILIDFKKNIESNSYVEDVDIPISSFEVESNLEFVLNFTYVPAKPKVLPKKGK